MGVTRTLMAMCSGPGCPNEVPSGPGGCITQKDLAAELAYKEDCRRTHQRYEEKDWFCSMKCHHNWQDVNLPKQRGGARPGAGRPSAKGKAA